ncbi:hypothetical protein ARMSODRAFT_981154 [Armillaria solidipes]|uniref:Uncharacterized protein n=1 Tax=Armillaria solidipes TaxID=1076256 RepID=A0A2H3ATA0_9AGAR|nr:hypothetical protein ARMSODRAFT_981154 [Armillaria solidipes]
MPHVRTPEEPEDVEMINLESPAIVGQRAESSRLNPSDEISKTKATRVTVPIGELMAQSAKLRKQMIKELQTRTVRFENGKENEVRNLPSMINTARVHNLTSRPEGKKPDERASLVVIKVNIGLGDRRLWVNAIVDSGSEVNIISRPVAKELNKDYPVMPLEEARCADANGNQGVLTGKFSDVLLFQGSVVTNAALFVGSYKTELLVVPEPWDTQTEGPVPSYYVEQDELEFEGSWRLQDGEEIVPVGTSQYNAYMSRITPPENPMILKSRNDDDRSLDSWDLNSSSNESSEVVESLESETSCTSEDLENENQDNISLEYQEIAKQEEGTYRKVADWRNKQLIRSPAPGQPMIAKERQGIVLYTKAEGKRVYYPRRRLPLWSILGTSEPEEETAIKTKMCSPKDVFDVLSAEIRHLMSQIPLRRGRTTYKSESTSEDESPNTISKRVQNLCRHDDGGVMPPLPPNDVPHPDALRNSGIYYPLLPSVATTHLNYLHNSLSHPSVTGPLSFHAIVLSTNHALRLETDVIRGQRVQRTHAFNASLAELQGPDGLPISSRVGHAVIFFFPGEHELMMKTVPTGLEFWFRAKPGLGKTREIGMTRDGICLLFDGGTPTLRMLTLTQNLS